MVLQDARIVLRAGDFVDSAAFLLLRDLQPTRRGSSTGARRNLTYTQRTPRLWSHNSVNSQTRCALEDVNRLLRAGSKDTIRLQGGVEALFWFNKRCN